MLFGVDRSQLLAKIGPRHDKGHKAYKYFRFHIDDRLDVNYHAILLDALYQYFRV